MSVTLCLLSASIALVTLGCSNCSPQDLQPSLRIPRRGIGFDWGVFYSQVQKDYEKQKVRKVKSVEDDMVEPVRCSIKELRPHISHGHCSQFGACVVGTSQYYGGLCFGKVRMSHDSIRIKRFYGT